MAPIAIADNTRLEQRSTTVDPGTAQIDPHVTSATPVRRAYDLFSLANQGVIVTGGARGLGLCIATSLLEAHASHVYCLDILDTPLETEWQVALQTAKEMGGSISYRQLDITDQAAVQRVIGEIYDECQVEITGFFGAAGIQQMIPALEYPVEQFRKMMDVNVTGTFLTIQAVAQQMKQRGIAGASS